MSFLPFVRVLMKQSCAVLFSSSSPLLLSHETDAVFTTMATTKKNESCSGAHIIARYSATLYFSFSFFTATHCSVVKPQQQQQRN
jgi:hypothetical protein